MICEKKDELLARALTKSLFASPGFTRAVSLEFCLALCFQNDNGLAEKFKLLESLRKHKLVQDKITSTMIPDLLNLDVCTPLTPEQISTVTDNLAMPAAEKKNPTAHQLLL
jgi:hypothetical protein